jgi:putative PIN family toxin of toxin-antitoxin system
MRVVLDTNVFISGIFWKGPSEKLLARWIGDSFTVIVSRPILEEYEDVFHRMEKPENSAVLQWWRHALMELSEWVEPLPMAKTSRDPKDDKFLEAAVGGKADVLVSLDKDLLVLKQIRGIPIVDPIYFLHHHLK